MFKSKSQKQSDMPKQTNQGPQDQNWLVLKNIDISDISSKTKCKNIIGEFYGNFLEILQQITKNASVTGGYQFSSPVFTILNDPVQDQNIPELLTQATAGKLKMTDFLKWPDVKKDKFLHTLFTYFDKERNKYETFIEKYKNSAASQSTSILDWFSEKDDKGNKYVRKVIMHLERMIIAMIRRYQFSIMMEEASMYEPLTNSHQHVTELKQLWQKASKFDTFDTSAIPDLKKKVEESFTLLKKAAIAYNQVSHFIYDPKVDETRFHVKPKYKMATELQADIISLNVVIDGMDTQVEVESNYKENEDYKQLMKDLQFSGNRFNVATEKLNLDLPEFKATEEENKEINSPLVTSPSPSVTGDEYTQPPPYNPTMIPVAESERKEETSMLTNDLSNTTAYASVTSSQEDINDNINYIGNQPIRSSSPHINPSILKNSKQQGKENLSNQFEKAYQNLERTLQRIQDTLATSKELKKTRCNNLLDDLKKTTELAKNTQVKEEPPDEETRNKMDIAIETSFNVQDQLTDIIDGINDNENLRKQLPQANWQTWYGEAETYLSFKREMLPHLKSLTTEELKLSTLKAHMKGNECQRIIKKFNGITTLNKFIEELDKRYGKIEKQIPRKLEELKRLRWKPRGKLEELPNVEKMLSYVRTCQSFGAEENIGLVWITEFANLLTEDNAIKLMATDGDSRRIIKLLEKISEEDENYRDIQPRKYEIKFNNFGHNGVTKCFICNGNHLGPKCPLMSQNKTMTERESEVKKRGLCPKCLYRSGPNHQCRSRFFICHQHNKNFLICHCQRNQGHNGRRNAGNVSDGVVQSNEIRINNHQSEEATVTNLITEVIELEDDYGQPHKVLCLYDHGNTNTGIDSDKANEIYGWKAYSHKIRVDNFLTGSKIVSCNRRSIKIKTFNNPLPHEVEVFSVHNLNQEYDRKSYTVPDAWTKEFNMVKHPTSPKGTSTLVIGIDTPHLLPFDLNKIHDGVILFRSRITNKILVAGKVREQNGQQFSNNRIQFHPIHNTHEQMYKNMSTDGIESSRQLKCTKCISLTDKCVECKKKNKPVPKQQVEFEEAVKKNLEYDEENKRYTANYIYNPELERLPVNEEPALRLMKNFERKIDELGLTLAVNKQYSKFRKSVIKLDSEEPLDPDLQKSYIVMCYSLANNEHKNTKVRLCMNSSFKTGEDQVSLNECMIDGPQYLNDMNGILTRWRFYAHCAYADISTAYHQILNSEKDKALRSLWVKPTMFGKEAGEPWVKAHCCVCQFGDKLAGAFCSYAIFDTAHKFMQPKNKDRLINNIMMDDIILGDYQNNTNLKMNVQDVDNGLNQGNLSVKGWSYSGEKSETTKILSYMYDSENDTFSPRTNFNWSKIKRGARSGSSLEKIEEIGDYFKKYPLTKKAIASIVMGTCHDPLGIVAPYINNLKFIYSKVTKLDIDWKDEISTDLKAEMTKAITLMFGIEKLKFPRRVAFIEATTIEVLFFFDGSLQGVGCSTVIKNIFKDKPPIIRLLKNKCRVTGKDCNTAPRSELMSCLIASRVYDILKFEMAEFLEEFKGNVEFKFIGDSQIVLSQLKKSSYLFKMWASSKINEIQELTRNIDGVEPQFYHCPSEKNLADILTRPYDVKDYLPWMEDLPDIELSPFKNPEEDLKLPEINKRNVKINNLNMESNVTLNQIAFYNQYVNSKTEDGDILDTLLGKMSNYIRYKNAVARILYWKKKKKKDFSEIQEEAENLIFRHFQSKEKDFVEKFKGDIYYKTEIDGVAVLKGRKTPRGETVMKIVPPNTLLYNRITRTYHERYEQSPQYIQAQMIKDGYYCPGIVNRLKKIQRNCPRCRRRLQETKPPEMGMLHDKRLIPSRPFLNVQMDLSGPHFVKDFVNRRAHSRKIWLLITICDYTRQISLVVVEDLSKQSLMNAMQTHFNRFGLAKRIESDLGTNFQAVLKELGKTGGDDDNFKDDDLKFLQRELQSSGVNLVQRSAHAPFLQGSAEHAVKMTKRALKCYKSPLTTFAWIQLLEKTMKILNRRPIGARTTGEVLTPDDLNPIHSGINEEIAVDKDQSNMEKYKDVVEQLQESFKRKWFEFYYRSILTQKKWIDRNAVFEMDDLVLIMDHKNQFGYPQIAKIVHIKKDSNGVDRYFSCSYKLNKVIKTLIRTQQSLSLILKNTDDKDVNHFDIPQFDDEKENTLETKRLKVKFQKDDQSELIQDV